MEHERVVRTRVVATAGQEFTFGSGYVVSPGRVLTAGHVLIPPQTEGPPRVGQACEVQCWAEEEWRAGEVIWVHPFDLAVVAVEDLGAGLLAPRFGRLEGDDPLPWAAVGYPQASLDDSGRQPEHAWGETSPLTQAAAQKLGLTVNSRHVRPAATSGWAGLSGAAVFCGQHLVGVVVSDPRAYVGSLGAHRIEAVADDAEFAAALEAAPVVEAVSGRPLEPGLRDVRVLLPDTTTTFTGRSEELAALARAEAAPVVLTQVVAGLGGVGKTALAAHYAHHRFYGDHAVDIAWWFTAAERASLLSAMAGVYEQLTAMPSGQEAAWGAARLRNWLENCPWRWLVVFDNADLPGILEGLVPHAGQGQVLITSRRADWSAIGATVHALGVLPTDEAVALLATTSGHPDDEGLSELAQELGGLALALEQAGAFMRKTAWGARRYLEMLRSRPLRLLGEDLAGTGRSTALVVDSSLEQAAAAHPLAPEVLGVLGYFAAEDIPRRLFVSPAVYEETLLGADSLEAELALAALGEYSLITVDPDALGVHRLVQHLSRLRGEEQGGSSHAATAVRLLSSQLTNGPTEPDAIGRLVPHVVEASAHAIRLGAAPEETAHLLNEVAIDRIELGRLDTARLLLDRAATVAEVALGPDHAGTLTIRHNLALWLGETGRVDVAAAQFQTLLADRLRVLGPDHPDTLRTRGNLVRWLDQAGWVEEAVVQCRGLLADHGRVVGPDHPDTLTTRSQLAYLVGETGRAGEALAQFRALLADRQRVLGADHLDTLTTRHNVAFWLGETGAAGEALAQLHAVLADQQRLLGADHPETLTTRNNFAYLLVQAGGVEEGAAQFQALLADRQRVLGPDHPHTLTTRASLAYLLGQRGRVEEAITQTQALLADQQRVLGHDHPETVTTQANLAHWLRRAGSLDEPGQG